ncbi:MAG TPA: STAS domain-containing protein, partial [Verrucomicrobiae bacterium]|jgi:anti-anti-sigma regulatory factor
MNPPATQLLVAIVDRVVVIKITGRANFTLSVDFKRLVAELRARGHKCFALELSQCLMMDSTFLGVLAGMGLKLAEDETTQNNPICLIASNSRILDMLDNLGVKHLFKVVDNSAPVPEAFQPVESAAASAPKTEISRTCLEAHELLMAINPANVAKFKDVTAFLAEDLKRIEAENPKA